MTSLFRKAALGSALAASMTLAAAPAEARDRYRDRGDNDAAIAIGAGLIGLALGAAIASDNDRYDDRYVYDRRYRGYYRNDAYPVYRAPPRYPYRYRDRQWRDDGRYHDRRTRYRYGY